ncbi:MAG: outer membrane beta-barrel protein [Saprospiraceae bacterium]
MLKSLEKSILISAQVLLISNIIFCQAEIGVTGGIHINNQITLNPNIYPKTTLNPQMSEGFNITLFYQKPIKRDLFLRGQLLISSFKKRFKINSGGKLFTSVTKGEIKPTEISIGVVPTIKITDKPIIQVGFGANYIHQINNPKVNIITTAHNFHAGESITIEKTINQSEIINKNGLGLIFNAEMKIPITSDIKLVTGLNVNQQITRFVSANVSDSKVYTGIIGYVIGIMIE